MMLLVSLEEKDTPNALTIPRPGDRVTWALGVPAFSTSTRSGIVLSVTVEDGGEYVFYAARDNGTKVWGWLGNILTVNGETVPNATMAL
jgi:hypothetical protein